MGLLSVLDGIGRLMRRAGRDWLREERWQSVGVSEIMATEGAASNFESNDAVRQSVSSLRVQREAADG